MAAGRALAPRVKAGEQDPSNWPLAGAVIPVATGARAFLASGFCSPCTPVPTTHNKEGGGPGLFPATLTWLLSDFEAACLANVLAQLPSQSHWHPTYQKEHSLLQALLGELVKAALADELLQDRMRSPFVLL